MRDIVTSIGRLMLEKDGKYYPLEVLIPRNGTVCESCDKEDISIRYYRSKNEKGVPVLCLSLCADCARRGAYGFRIEPSLVGF